MLDDAVDRLQPAEVSAFPVRELAAEPGPLPGSLEVTAMRGDESEREHVKRSQDPVLNVDRVGALGVLLGLQPPTRSQLDERQKPECGGGGPLILVAPPPVVRLISSRARSVMTDQLRTWPSVNAAPRSC